MAVSSLLSPRGLWCCWQWFPANPTRKAMATCSTCLALLYCGGQQHCGTCWRLSWALELVFFGDTVETGERPHIYMLTCTVQSWLKSCCCKWTSRTVFQSTKEWQKLLFFHHKKFCQVMGTFQWQCRKREWRRLCCLRWTSNEFKAEKQQFMYYPLCWETKVSSASELMVPCNGTF